MLDPAAVPRCSTGTSTSTRCCAPTETPAARDACDVDIVHSANHLLPRTARPTVLTVHDVFILTWPQQYPRVKRALLPAQFRAAVRAATAVISVSNTTRDRLAALEPAAAEK